MQSGQIIQSIYHLSNQSFGQDYLTLAQIQEYTTNPTYTLLHTEKEGVLQGFTVLQQTSIQAIFSTKPKDLKALGILLPKKISIQHKIWHRKHTIVAAPYRNQKIGSALFQQSLCLKPQLPFLAIRWVAPHNSMSYLYAKHGFTQLCTLPNYWQADSQQKGYLCQGCFKIPCCCNAELWLKIP